MELNYKPLYGQVLIKQPNINKEYKGGIIKSTDTIKKEQTDIGKLPQKILAVSEGQETIKVGDYCHFRIESTPYTMYLLNAKGKEEVYLSFSVGDIIGVIPNPDVYIKREEEISKQYENAPSKIMK